MVSRSGTVLGRVGGRYRIVSVGETLTASLRGRLKSPDEARVLVGDQVTIDVASDGSAAITGVLPRRSLLQRRMPGKSGAARPIAANVDQVVVVGATARPDWHANLIDRFLAVAEANELPVLLVINKCDLKAPAQEQMAPYRAAEYQVVVTSAVTGEGCDALASKLGDQVSLFTGPTGVGKSSLLNRIQPGLGLRTGEVSQRRGTGRHTTVSAEMLPLVGGGYVVDTPGLRDIGLWALTPESVTRVFPDIARLARGCRFDDCRHLEEPECAVVAAVDRAVLAPSRLESYRQLLTEVSP